MNKENGNKLIKEYNEKVTSKIDDLMKDTKKYLYQAKVDKLSKEEKEEIACDILFKLSNIESTQEHYQKELKKMNLL